MPGSKDFIMFCKGKTKDGGQCSAKQVRENGFCFWHDPGLEEQRRESSAKGGKNRRSEARAIAAMKRYNGVELDTILCSVLAGLLTGEYEPGIATAAANLARTLTQIRSTQDIERRIEEIEKYMHRRVA